MFQITDLDYFFEDNKLRWVKILGIIGIPMALGVHGGTGSIFAVQIAKPYWNNKHGRGKG